jgi:transposase
MFMTNTKKEVMEVLTGLERRRRWLTDEKLPMVKESFEPGKTVSMVVARQHGVSPNQLFHGRKLYQDGSLSAASVDEEVVPASELNDALKQIRELQRLLGKKTMENEILKEAVEVMKSRKWLARSPLLPGDDL